MGLQETPFEKQNIFYNEIYEYIVDSSHNNVTMISDDSVVGCTIDESYTFQLFALVNDYNKNNTSSYTKIDVSILSSNELVSNCRDIGHVLIGQCNGSLTCSLLSCNPKSSDLLPEGIYCSENNFQCYTRLLV